MLLIKAISRGLSILALLLVMGCGDAEDDVLPPGSLAVVGGEKGAYLDPGLARLEPGVLVRVGNDPGFLEEGPEGFEERLSRSLPANREHDREAGPLRWRAGAGVSKYRKVSVSVESGEARNASGKVSRLVLRPVR